MPPDNQYIGQFIDQYIDAQVSVITLKDSVNGNRLNHAFLQELSRAFKNSASNKDVRVIVLRSSSDVFCLGMDIIKLRIGTDRKQELKSSLSLYIDLLSAIYNCPQPVICLLTGEVKAGGVGIICACDIVLATEQASVCLSEVLFGLIPANVLPYLLFLRISPQKTRYLVLTSKELDAAEAKSLNLIDEIYSTDSFEKSVCGIIKRLFRSSPDALFETKQFTRILQGKDLNLACSMARDKLIEIIDKPEVMRGISAFNDGELPEWFGKYRPEKPVTGVTG